MKKNKWLWLWLLFREFMLRNRPEDFKDEEAWKRVFSYSIRQDADEWPESMLFWLVQLGNLSR